MFFVQMLSELKAFDDPVVSGALVFAIVGPTVFAFTAMSFSSQKLKPSITASYITLQPVIVAVLSLLLFGKTFGLEEVSSGAVVLIGLYFTIIGNPRLDREWAEYVSDLPGNVPQTIATVADASVSAAETLGDKVTERLDTLVASTGEVLEKVTTSSSEERGSSDDSQ